RFDCDWSSDVCSSDLGKLRLVADFLQDRLDALAVFGNWRTADLHLDDVVAAVEITAHLPAQRGQILTGIIIAAGRIDEHARIGRSEERRVGKECRSGG